MKPRPQFSLAQLLALVTVLCVMSAFPIATLMVVMALLGTLVLFAAALFAGLIFIVVVMLPLEMVLNAIDRFRQTPTRVADFGAPR